MATVYNTVKDAAGNLLTGQVVIDLVVISGSAVSFQGFVDLSNVTTDYTINTATTLTLNNGQWQANLRGNSAINDAYGSTVVTYYKVAESSNGVTRTYFIQVPDDNNSYWVGDLVTATPSTASLGFNLDSLTDVDVLNPSDGQFLQWNAASELWVATTIPGLSDVTSKQIIQFSAPGILQPVTGTMAQYIPYGFTITGVYLHVEGAPLGTPIICDVKIDGNTIFTNSSPNRRPQIAVGSNVSTGGIPGSGDTPSGSNKVVSVDINQIGSSFNEGTNLTVSVAVTYT